MKEILITIKFLLRQFLLMNQQQLLIDVNYVYQKTELKINVIPDIYKTIQLNTLNFNL